MPRRLIVGFGNARLHGRDESQRKDLDAPRIRRGKSGIGF